MRRMRSWATARRRATWSTLAYSRGHYFPGKVSATSVDASELSVFLIRRLGEAWHLLHREVRRALPYRWVGEAARVAGIRPPKVANLEQETRRILKAFFAALPSVRRMLVADVQAAYDGDPAR